MQTEDSDEPGPSAQHQDAQRRSRHHLRSLQWRKATPTRTAAATGTAVSASKPAASAASVMWTTKSADHDARKRGRIALIVVRRRK